MRAHRIMILISFIIGLIVWKNYISKSSVIGKYVNNNTQPISEGPNSIFNGHDTLVLFDNGKFQSGTWGSGTYQLNLDFMDSKIELNYGNGWGAFSTSISKSLLGKPRICLDYDLGFYFEKID